LQDPGLFKEEYNDLGNASDALFADGDELLSFEFAPHVSLWDLLKVQRLFNFMRFYLSHRVLGLRNSRPQVLLQSMVPAFTDSKLRQLLGFVVPEFKVSALIKFLSWDPGSDGHFDVQYQPIIRTEHEYLVPASVLGSSNSLRNSFQLCRKRLYPDGAHDPLSVALLNSFRDHTAYTRANVRYCWKTESGELDVLALFDGRLFVVECKNSLLPTGPHELRTSYDYIQTAAEQLNRFSRVYGDPHYRDLLAKNLGWPITPSTRLVTCIVMSNRMFSGYRITKHAVRGAGEFTGFMSHGSLRLALEDCSESHSFWKGDKLSGEDLEEFIDGDVTYKPRWHALEEYPLRYCFGTYAVDQVSYRMVALALARNLGFPRIAAGIEALERGEKTNVVLEPNKSPSRPNCTHRTEG
jgi:hypothetical protein